MKIEKQLQEIIDLLKKQDNKVTVPYVPYFPQPNYNQSYWCSVCNQWVYGYHVCCPNHWNRNFINYPYMQCTDNTGCVGGPVLLTSSTQCGTLN